MPKIGMCCACGYGFPKSQTRLYQGFEYCLTCCDQMGLEEEDFLDPLDGPDEEDLPARRSDRRGTRRKKRGAIVDSAGNGDGTGIAKGKGRK